MSDESYTNDLDDLDDESTGINLNRLHHDQSQLEDFDQARHDVETREIVSRFDSIINNIIVKDQLNSAFRQPSQAVFTDESRNLDGLGQYTTTMPSDQDRLWLGVTVGYFTQICTIPPITYAILRILILTLMMLIPSLVL
jgi:hypothetical protein